MIAIKALYKQGEVEFLEPPPDIAQALVAIVFLETEETIEDVLASYADLIDTMDWGEPMDEDGARTMVALHDELAPYRVEASRTGLDLGTE